MYYLQAITGFIAFLLLAWLFSENRRKLEWRVIIPGIIAQFVIAAALLHTDIFIPVFQGINAFVTSVATATDAGTEFVFGFLAGGQKPFKVTEQDAMQIFAIDILPIVFVMGALSALLWHWRILPMIIRGLAWALRRCMGVSGVVGFSACANIFISMTETPLFIRYYVPVISRSKLFSIMSVGLATIAGVLFVPFAAILDGVIQRPITHLLTASIISIPAALVLARIMIPEDAATYQQDSDKIDPGSEFANAVDAVVSGAIRSTPLFLNVIVMLIVFIAFVDLIDQILTGVPAIGGDPVTLKRIFGWLFAPLVYAMGIPWNEAAQAGTLMGIKTALNEFIAFIELSKLEAEALSERSRIIMTYALCGFANFASVGIMTGAFIAIAPERQREIQILAFKSLITGTLATLMTGCVVGIIY